MGEDIEHTIQELKSQEEKRVSYMEYCKIYGEKDNLLIYIMKMYEDRDGGDNIEIRAEKENNMDVYARFVLPANYCTHAYGFTETELFQIEDFLRDNAVSIWDMARGIIHAESVA